MMATASIRETRRRRILERGSDRLALITGRTPTQSSTSQDLDFAGGFSPPSISDHQDFTPSVHHNEENKSADHSRTTSDLVSEFNRMDTLVSGCKEEVLVHDTETSDNACQVHSRSDSSGSIHNLPGRFPQVHQRSAVRMNFHELFTYQQVTSAVAATEQFRMFCSLTVAFLVVLSYMELPIVINNQLIGTIIRFRPLCIVLLANMFMILVHLLLEEPQGMERARKEADKSDMANEDYGWAKDSGRSIEMAFMALSVIVALFMDCTVYSIIIVCGVSVA